MSDQKKLVCPYTVEMEQFVQHSYEYDDEGRCTKDSYKLIEKRPFVECEKEACAAWQEGCQYRGAVN